MTTFGKSVLAFILAVIIGGAIYGAYQYPKAILPSFGSPVNTTFSSAKVVAVDMSPLTQTATSTSIQNTDASNRWIASFGFAGCTGVQNSQTDLTGTGLASWFVQAATTSVPNQGLQGNTNYALNMTIPTSTAGVPAIVAVSSSTPSAISGIWAPGSYMTFTFNATNTAACVVELDYIPS